VACAAAPCPQPGACCFADGACAVVGGIGGAECAVLGGTYQGDDASCGSVVCAVAGACCFASGACAVAADVGGDDCGDAGGTYQGDNTDCGSADCPQPSGTITTIAGTGTAGASGDGAAATAAQLKDPDGVDVDSAGHLFVADRGNNRIRRIDAVTGVITTVAGNGSAGDSGDGGPATAAALRKPSDVFIDGAGNVFIADTENSRIRCVDAATGVITTVAGNGADGFSGDGGPATAARIRKPQGVFVDGAGNLFIADTDNNRIRRVDAATGIITTVAGSGAAGFSGDGGPATAAALRKPEDVFVHGAGAIFIADRDNHRIRRVNAMTGVISTIAGTGTGGFAGDGGPATSARLDKPAALCVSGVDLFIADRDNNRIRRVDLLIGVITTCAGNGSAAFAGDGGAATAASIDRAEGVAIDLAGDLEIGDTGNERIREVDLGVD
jgi:sugar lactone lactonase YvrE